MSRILAPSEINDGAGGKARALADLQRARFAPPAFFVVLPGPDPVREDLDPYLQKIGPGPYAVRSSAQGEDGVALSHAGQFLTELNVAVSDVAAAITRVSRSGLNETVGAYRSAHQADDGTGEIAVLVQQMIQARVAGVAFSADPVSGRRDRIVISATEGLADALVSGEVDGETWLLGRDGVIIERPKDPVLTEKEATRIADLVGRAETHFQAPQDIEWAIDDDGLHILQSRPITTALRGVPNVEAVPIVFDNSNIVESYPGLVSPLTYSFAVHVYARVYRAFVRLLGIREADIQANARVFDNMLGRVDGRVYYNLVNWYRALALLPGFSLNRGYMETMMGVSEPLPPEIVSEIAPPAPTIWRKLRDGLRMVRAGFGLIWQAVILRRTRRRFMDRLDRALGSGLDLTTASLGELAGEYRAIEAQLLDRWDAPLINDFLCMIGFGASRNLLIRWLGDQGATLHNDVMIGQGDIISAEPAQRIVEMAMIVRDHDLIETLQADGIAVIQNAPPLDAAFNAYLARFGDRCVQELKLESVPLGEDPAPLAAAILAQAGAPARRHEPKAETDWTAVFPGRPLRRWFTKRFVGWAKQRVRDRENLRFERTRIFGHARRVFLAMGRELVSHGLLDNPRDVFSLTVAEVLGVAEGSGLSTDLRGLTRLRRDEEDASATRPDPPERITLTGPNYVAAATQQATAVTGISAVGTGCSAGTVTGTARVISDPATQTLAAGEILVARHTDPGWIAVFAAAAAIVVERGSLLSHSAIVARELGIPCVVALKEATRWIQDGEMITVDGASGKVTRQDG